MSTGAQGIRSGLRVAVTGASGFIGSQVVATCQRRGHPVAAMVRDVGAAQRRHADLGIEHPPYIEAGSLKELYDAAVAWEPDVVIHTIGAYCREPGWTAWEQGLESNVGALVELVEALVVGRAASPRPIIVAAGSQAEYGAAASPWSEDAVPLPTSAYGATKLAASELLGAATRSGLVRGAVVRLPIVYGPGQQPVMFVPELMMAAHSGAVLQTTPGDQRRCFLFVDDAAACLLDVAERMHDGAEMPAVINAPSPEPVRLRDVVAVVEGLHPATRVALGALPYREDERMDAWMDTSVARRLGLAAAPTDLPSGLRTTFEWYGSVERLVEEGRDDA